MKLLLPIPVGYFDKISQTFAEHVARAKRNGWCPGPGNCPGGIYYYGGIDYYIPTGTPVIASADGTIVKASMDSTGYGHHIRIQHAEGFMTVYGHMNTLNVSLGDKVSAGTIIGFSDNTGNSTGPHLHWELRINGIPVDPAYYLTSNVPDEIPPTPIEEEQPIPIFPELPKVIIVSDVINIRDNPWGRVIGRVIKDDVIKVQGITKTEEDGTLWMIIGHRQFVAMKTKSDGYMAKWI